MPRGIYDRSKMKKPAKKTARKAVKKAVRKVTKPVVKKVVKRTARKIAKPSPEVRKTRKPAKRAQFRRYETVAEVLQLPQYRGLTINNTNSPAGLQVSHVTHGELGVMPYFKGNRKVTAKQLQRELDKIVETWVIMHGRPLNAEMIQPSPLAAFPKVNVPEQVGLPSVDDTLGELESEALISNMRKAFGETFDSYNEQIKAELAERTKVTTSNQASSAWASTAYGFGTGYRSYSLDFTETYSALHSYSRIQKTLNDAKLHPTYMAAATTLRQACSRQINLLTDEIAPQHNCGCNR